MGNSVLLEKQRVEVDGFEIFSPRWLRNSFSWDTTLSQWGILKLFFEEKQWPFLQGPIPSLEKSRSV